MKKLSVFLGMSLYIMVLFSQDSILWKPIKIINLSQHYQQIEADPEGNIYVVDSKKNKISKLFVETNYDSTYTIGGMSGRQEGFLHIAQLSTKNRQTIYVLDDAERRITVLNTNLKVTGGISFLNEGGEEADILPLSFEVSGAGELFVLNSLDNKVYKFDSKGKLINAFGGQDYGEGILQNPIQVAVSDENQIYVLDTLQQEIKVFDMYGIFLRKISVHSDNSKKIVLFAEDLIMQSDEQIVIMHIPTGKTLTMKIPANLQQYTDIAVSKVGIYLLWENHINIYKVLW